MTQTDVLEVVRRFREDKGKQYSIIRLGIFGSAARDRILETSDVDIVVELAHPDLFALVGIKQDPEELLDCRVDIVRHRERMNEFLKRRIEQEAIYV